MIAHLTGRIRAKHPTILLVDVGGIGLEVHVPLTTATRVGEVGGEVGLYTRLLVRPDGFELYGFDREEERSLFVTLTGVTGVGPRAALNLLSRFDADQLRAAIRDERTDLLRAIPGIGPKKAGRLILELKPALARPAAPPTAAEDAVRALEALGLNRGQALARLKRIPDLDRLSLAEIVRRALHDERPDA